MLWPLPSFASGNAKTVSLATWLACDAPHLVSGRRVTDSSAGRGGTESPPQPRENSPDFFLSHPNLLMNLLQSLWTCFKERKCADYYFRLFAIRCRRKGFGCVGSARVGAVLGYSIRLLTSASVTRVNSTLADCFGHVPRRFDVRMRNDRIWVNRLRRKILFWKTETQSLTTRITN